MLHKPKNAFTHKIFEIQHFHCKDCNFENEKLIFDKALVLHRPQIDNFLQFSKLESVLDIGAPH